MDSMSNPFRGDRGKVKLSDAVAEDILRWSYLKGLGPGDRLPQEKELTEIFDCSRGTLREALKALEVQGLVTMVTGPKGGPRLTRVTEDRAMKLLTTFFYFQKLDSRSIYEVRIMIEPLMVRAAIDHLTEEDFDALRQSVEVCERGHEGKVDAATHRAAEIQFHHTIAHRVPNPFLRFFCIFVNHALYSMITPKAVAHGEMDPFSDHVIHAHQDIILALERRDADAAADLMLEHLVTASKMVEDMELSFHRTLFDPVFSSQLDLSRALEALSKHDPRSDAKATNTSDD